MLKNFKAAEQNQLYMWGTLPSYQLSMLDSATDNMHLVLHIVWRRWVSNIILIMT